MTQTQLILLPAHCQNPRSVVASGYQEVFTVSLSATRLPHVADGPPPLLPSRVVPHHRRLRQTIADQDRITQQILVDGVIVAAFVYTLERTVIPGSPPSAELLGFQKYRIPVRDRTTSHPFSPPLTPEASQSSAAFYAGGAYHNPMLPQASISAQLPRDTIDPSLTRTSGYSGPMSAPTTSGMLYRPS